LTFTDRIQSRFAFIRFHMVGISESANFYGAMLVVVKTVSL